MYSYRTTPEWQSYLKDGEKILWKGRPKTGLRLQKYDIFAIFFSLVFFGFLIYPQLKEYYEDASSFPSLFTLAVGALGIYFVVGRFFWEAFKRRHTYYILTNRRAVIATNYWKYEVRNFPLQDRLVEYRPGKETTIIFERETIETDEGKETIEHGFKHISDGEVVYRLIKEVRRGTYDKN